jgi:hypothetical protein
LHALDLSDEGLLADLEKRYAVASGSRELALKAVGDGKKHKH